MKIVTDVFFRTVMYNEKQIIRVITGISSYDILIKNDMKKITKFKKKKKNEICMDESFKI